MRKAEDMKSGTEIGAGEETVSHAIRESRQEISSTVIRIAEYARLCFSLQHTNVCEKRLTCKGINEAH